MNATYKVSIRALLVGALATWYIATTPSGDTLKKKQDYQLPQTIEVVETSLPTETRTVINEQGESHLEKIITPEKCDLSKKFTIKTDRYTLVKDQDWLPSRAIGFLSSLWGKVFFWDWDYAKGQDGHRARAALSMLENNPDLKDVTVRLDHNEALSDMVRMFQDPTLKGNPLAARILVGIPVSIGDELWAELLRGSYYNNLTRTVVCYSNIESITAHEIGHHRDFERFPSNWWYGLGRILPPVTLYQEWKASDHAKDLLQKDDQWQYNRYLIPAFGTYVLAMIGLFKRKKKEESSASYRIGRTTRRPDHSFSQGYGYPYSRRQYYTKR